MTLLDWLLISILLTVSFTVNLRVFWFYKNDKDPLKAITKPLWEELVEDDQILQEISDRG